jgi:lysophospholipase L1-like esterase
MSLSQIVAISKKNSNDSSNLKNSSNFVNAMQLAFTKYKGDNTYKGNMLCIGDSAVEGSAGVGTNQTYIGLLNSAIMTKQLATTMDEYTYYPSEGNPTGNTAFGAFTGTWTNVNNAYSTVGEGTVTDPSDNLSGKMRGWCKTTENNATMTVHSYGYKLRLLFASDGVFAEAPGSISIVVNGGAPTNVNLAGSTKYKWVDIDPEGSYDVVFTATTTGGKAVACQVVHYVYNFVSLKCINFATGGSGAYHWAQRLNIIDAYAPKLTYVGLGGNDIYHNRTDAQYETAMRAILTKLKSYGDVICGYYFPVDVTHANLSALTAQEKADMLLKVERFRVIAQRLALEYGALFIDYHNVFVDGATMTANELLLDEIHPNINGHEMKYQYLRSKLYI